MINQGLKYGFGSARLEIEQGFAYLSVNKDIQQDERMSQFSQALALKESDEKLMRAALDSIQNASQIGSQLFAEIKAQQPGLGDVIVQPSVAISDSMSKRTMVVILTLSSKPSI
ncbi:MAG: hypothetical protein V4722_01255 [Bacteroidota bacterium]